MALCNSCINKMGLNKHNFDSYNPCPNCDTMEDLYTVMSQDIANSWFDNHTGEDLIESMANFRTTYNLTEQQAGIYYLTWWNS
jgi:hypothetical protein